MLFYMFLCLTVQRQHLLSRNRCDTVAVTQLEISTRKKEDQIFKIIDKVLKQVFGEEATLFIYRYLEQHYSLRQSEFSEKIDVFAKGLEECLSSGAFAIENKILEDISSIYGTFSKTRFERKPERYDFASQMKIAMRKA
jgi:hypothetical protein